MRFENSGANFEFDTTEVLAAEGIDQGARRTAVRRKPALVQRDARPVQREAPGEGQERHLGKARRAGFAETRILTLDRKYLYMNLLYRILIIFLQPYMRHCPYREQRQLLGLRGEHQRA